MRNKKQTSPGVAGEFEELNTLLVISSEEEDAYKEWFGNSSDIELETIEYHKYFGNHSHRKK